MSLVIGPGPRRSTRSRARASEVAASAARPPQTDKVVFGVAAALVAAIVVWGLAATENFGTVTGNILDWIVVEFGWLFVLTASGFVFFALWLAVSRYGRIPLGKDDEKPEFRTVSWISMMFAAGMGIGLMFFGVAEPLSHFVEPPPGSNGGTGVAMATSMFHWSLHPWAIYAVVGLAIAYGTFRKGRKQLISSAFIPLLGRRAEGPLGKVIDILALFATLFGTAASLGLGALQIGSGFEVTGWLETAGVMLLVAIVALLTLAFIASAVTGVAKGIQYLSNINMVLAAILAIFVFVLGPTVFILNLVPTTLGAYAAEFARMSARTAASNEAAGEWLSSWTIFYWAWWVSWAPSSVCSSPASAAAAPSASSSSASSSSRASSASSGSRCSAAQVSDSNWTAWTSRVPTASKGSCSGCSATSRSPASPRSSRCSSSPSSSSPERTPRRW